MARSVPAATKTRGRAKFWRLQALMTKKRRQKKPWGNTQTMESSTGTWATSPPVEETSRNRPGPRLCTCCLCPGCQRPWPARSQFLNDQRKAREELLDSCHGGALGPLIQEAKLTTSDGAPVTIYFASFLVYLASPFPDGWQLP